MRTAVARSFVMALTLAGAGSAGVLHAGVLTPPAGPVATTGVTTQQIYDSVQGLATASGDSGMRTPGTDIAQPASMTVTPSGLPAFTTPIFAVTALFTSPTDPPSGLPTGPTQFNGMTVTRDAGAKSGLFFNFLLTNRNLQTVVLTLSTTPPVTYTLVNGRVTSYKLLMSQRPGGAYSEIEEIGLQFSSTFTVNDGTNSGVFDRSAP
jgi:hypothetical protein